MRVAFLTNRTTSVSLPVLKRLADSKEIDLCHTFFYDTISETRASFSTVIRQLGIRGFAMKFGQAMSYKVRTAAATLSHRAVLPSSFAHELAISNRLPFSIVSDMNRQDVIDKVHTLDIDILLVCVCKNILKREVLGIPKVASVNIHPSLLPKYRGPMPTFWMLYNGEETTGVTFHLMTPRIDDGDIISRYELPLDSRRTEQQIERGVFEVAAAHVEGVLQDLFDGATSPIPQCSEHATYYSFPTPKHRARQRRLQYP